MTRFAEISDERVDEGFSVFLNHTCDLEELVTSIAEGFGFSRSEGVTKLFADLTEVEKVNMDLR